MDTARLRLWSGPFTTHPTWGWKYGKGDCSLLLTLVPRTRIFLPWRWKRYVPPKRRFTQDLHGSTSQKTAFFIAPAFKTSNLTFIILFARDRYLSQSWPYKYFLISGRSQWPRCLRHEMSPLAQTLGYWVRIPLKAWMSVRVSSEFVLSCVSSGFAQSWSPVQGVLPTACKIHTSRSVLVGNMPEGLIWKAEEEDYFTVVSFTKNPGEQLAPWLLLF
jgi:hypothetical protein